MEVQRNKFIVFNEKERQISGSFLLVLHYSKLPKILARFGLSGLRSDIFSIEHTTESKLFFGGWEKLNVMHLFCVKIKQKLAIARMN